MPRPGIIGGAAQGVGRGRQVIAVARSADVVLMMLDATRPDAHRAALEAELSACGIRLNQVFYASVRIPIRERECKYKMPPSTLPCTNMRGGVEA